MCVVGAAAVGGRAGLLDVFGDELAGGVAGVLVLAVEPQLRALARRGIHLLKKDCRDVVH